MQPPQLGRSFFFVEADRAGSTGTLSISSLGGIVGRPYFWNKAHKSNATAYTLFWLNPNETCDFQLDPG